MRFLLAEGCKLHIVLGGLVIALSVGSVKKTARFELVQAITPVEIKVGPVGFGAGGRVEFLHCLGCVCVRFLFCFILVLVGGIEWFWPNPRKNYEENFSLGFCPEIFFPRCGRSHQRARSVSIC